MVITQLRITILDLAYMESVVSLKGLSSYPVQSRSRALCRISFCRQDLLD